MDDIDESNYVEYQNSNGIKIMETKSLIDTKWIPCIICETCVEMFIKDMMPNYRKNLLEADCRASQLRVLAQGPPIYVKVALQLQPHTQDDSVFTTPEGEHVESLWYSSSKQVKSAKVDVEVSFWYF